MDIRGLGLASGCVVLIGVVLFNCCVCLGVMYMLCIVLLCCDIGNSASLCVLGTVHLLPSREIWLWTNFEVMLLSLMKVVPPMTG